MTRWEQGRPPASSITSYRGPQLAGRGGEERPSSAPAWVTLQVERSGLDEQGRPFELLFPLPERSRAVATGRQRAEALEVCIGA